MILFSLIILLITNCYHSPKCAHFFLHLSGSDDLKEIRSWYLAGADINQGDYDRRTALHVVSYLS